MSRQYDRPAADAPTVLRERFQRHPVAELPELCRALSASGRTVFRVLGRIGYHSSYNHAGRYYTIEGIPRFDDDGLWFHDDIGFSMRGTLRTTVEALVQQSAAGCTHEELSRLLRLRVHDPLRSLVQAKRLGRERVEALYVYVSARARTARAQLEQRRRPKAAAKPPPSPPLDAARVIDVLLAVIHAPRASAADVGAELRQRGRAVSDTQVEEVFGRYGLRT
ncbi:MAG TPA: hypothetical protein VMK12_00695 [Anaeromyxobacteraceae bacterium]|nr:hypothetical protein [Anaeromyxobacteraceae bacterium]